MYSKVFNMAFSTIFNKYIYLIKALLVYTIIIILIHYIDMNNIVNVKGQMETDNSLIGFITFILSYFVLIMMAVTIHRVLILGENSIPQWGLFKFTKREWNFLINIFIMGLVIFAIIMPIFFLSIPFNKSSIAGIIIYLFMIIPAIIVSRFSLVFPAVSVDKNITLMDAWNYTQNYKLLVFITVIIFPIVFSFVFGTIYGLAIDFLSKLIGINLYFLNSILSVFITVFTISALSATYKLIVEEHPEYFISTSEKSEILRDTIIEESQNSYTIKIHDKQDYSFLQLKDEIHLQFFGLGFNETVVDKEDVWMIRNNQEEIKPYVSLTYKNDEYIIEGFKAPMVDFLN